MTTNNIFIIDSRVADYQRLMAALPVGSEAFLLNSDQDGIKQMQTILSNYSDLDSIQIISHGAQGVLYLGNTVLNQKNIDSYRTQLGDIGSSLTSSGDLLLYGCDVAQGGEGRQFIDHLALFTGADVAASDDLTGNAALGGDWELEAATGAIETAPQSLDYEGLLGLAVSPNTKSFPGRTSGEYGNIHAFAALKEDGSVVSWGIYSGDSSSVVSILVNVKQIYSTNSGFAALKEDGSVVTWNVGSVDDSASVADKLVNVKQIYSTFSAFAALKQDGSVVTWGWDLGGGDSSSVASKLVNVKQIYSADDSFAALKEDGSVVTWGNSSDGGDSSSVADKLDGTIDVIQIYSGGVAFAALRADGSVITWGDSSYGGDSSSVANKLDGTMDVTQIYSTDGGSFAALRADGSVVTWGHPSYGGDSSSVASQLSSGVVGLADIYTDDFYTVDPVWQITPNAPVVSEATDDTIEFTITRPADHLGTAETVYVSTHRLPGGPINEGDYVGLLNQPYTFAADKTSRIVVVDILPDSIAEPDETFGLIVQTNPTDLISNSLASTTFTISENVIPPINLAPTAQPVSPTKNLQPGKSIALNELFTWNDPNGLSDVVSFNVIDATVGSGFLKNGFLSAQEGEVIGPIPILDIESWYFTAGAAGSTNDLTFTVTDVAGETSTPASITVSTDFGEAPRFAGNTFKDVDNWETVEFVDLIKFDDSDGDIETIEIEYSNDDPNVGKLFLNNAEVDRSDLGYPIKIQADEIYRTALHMGPNDASTTIRTRAIDKAGNTSDWTDIHINQSKPLLTNQSGTKVTLFLDFNTPLDKKFSKDTNFLGEEFYKVEDQEQPLASFSDLKKQEIVSYTQRIFDQSNMSIIVTDSMPPSSAGKYLTVLFSPPHAGSGSFLAGLAYDVTPSFSYYGSDRFNLKKDGFVAVTMADFQSATVIAEVVAHEAGHGYGLEHQNAFVDNPTELMDYEGVFSSSEFDNLRFPFAPYPTFDDPSDPSTQNNETQNDSYHIFRYVLGENHDSLVARDIFPGTIDLKPFDVIALKLKLVTDPIISVINLNLLINSSVEAGEDHLPIARALTPAADGITYEFMVPTGTSVQLIGTLSNMGITQDFVVGFGDVSNPMFEFDPVIANSTAHVYIPDDITGQLNSIADIPTSVRHIESVDPGAANTSPFILDEYIISDEDVSFSLNPLVNDIDIDGDTLTLVSVSNGVNGNSTISADGTITYKPDINFWGADIISYMVSDGNGGSAYGAVNVTVLSVNDTPTGSPVGLLAAGEEDKIYTILQNDLLAGFSDVDGDALSITELAINHGTLSSFNSSTGSWIFTPDSNYNGIVNLTYGITDGSSGNVSGTDRSFSLDPVNDTIQAGDDYGSVNEDSKFTASFDVLMANDSDGDGDVLHISGIDTAGTLGQVTDNGDGTFNYNPNGAFDYLIAGESTIDSFVYTVSDGNGGNDTATVAITINGVNNAPIANDDKGAVNEDSSVTFSFAQLFANDINVDGVNQTITAIDTTGTAGSVVIDTVNQTITYSADADAFDLLTTGAVAQDSFKYTLQGSSGETSAATVAISVVGVDDGVSLFGTVRRDILNGTSGEDRIKGNNGNDVIYGGEGADNLFGGNGDDRLEGGNSIDNLFGGDGNDRLEGGAGNDWLSGKKGNDILIGGSGSDIFAFAKAGGRDIVNDFINSVDKIQIAANTGFTNFSQLKITSKADSGDVVYTTIDLGHSDKIFLVGVSPGQLDTTDFIFSV